MLLDDLDKLTVPVSVPYRNRTIDLGVFTETFHDPAYRKLWLECQTEGQQARAELEAINKDDTLTADERIAKTLALEETARLRDGRTLAPLIAYWNIEHAPGMPAAITPEVIARLSPVLRDELGKAILHEVVNPTTAPATSQAG